MNIVAPAAFAIDDSTADSDLTTLRIEGGQALIDGAFIETTIDLNATRGAISAIGADMAAPRRFDARGLLVLPGIVDMHGDAFERQVMPRPGVGFPVDLALLESDRQALANGITTIFHGVTWSWEPGLRGAENARAVLEAIERLRAQLGADTRFHLRHEIYNLDAEPCIIEWIAAGRIAVLAFNDHLSLTVQALNRPEKRAQMVQRSGLDHDGFHRLIAAVHDRSAEVPASIERLAAAARAANIPLLSHDDASPEQRRSFRALGCTIAEFPTNIGTAEEAMAAGDHVVFGAPNIVRGGSHIGCPRAAEMVARGLCTVLASDYYYPAPLHAAFRLAAEGIVPLAQAWSLVAEGPAAAVGLGDRGRLACGQRADVILVDASDPGRPRVAATIVAGRLVYLATPDRLHRF
jgi:alpha-D-ribose 1-methylphosphonate 5-triphosphate diphosphatase